jgi:hypothetical protein
MVNSILWFQTHAVCYSFRVRRIFGLIKTSVLSVKLNLVLNFIVVSKLWEGMNILEGGGIWSFVTPALGNGQSSECVECYRNIALFAVESSSLEHLPVALAVFWSVLTHVQNFASWNFFPHKIILVPCLAKHSSPVSPNVPKESRFIGHLSCFPLRSNYAV